MKYIKAIDIDDIRDKYKYIIGWGVGPLFQMNYNPYMFKLDAIIDGTGENKGKKVYGITVEDEKLLEKIEGKILIVIYAIYEVEIIQQIEKYEKNVDIIIYPLLEMGKRLYLPRINGKSAEDYILVTLLRQLHLNTLQYLEIGVCHPIFRNNTYLLNEMYSNYDGYKGVLVEANPLCWDLIEEYRSNDILLKYGVSVNTDVEKATFYMFPHFLGHSTFVEKTAREIIREGYTCEKLEIPTKNINAIIAENFITTPDILSLDVEGMDYDVIKSWDEEKYPIKIVLTEVCECGEKRIENLMIKKGYKCFATTMENAIWVQKEVDIFL